MTGTAATLPKYQFFDSVGAPLVNGTLTTYLAGTTTLTSTWQDSALTTLNTNPIVLDSRGECVLWLDRTKYYKMVLKNSAGVIQWTQDNIAGWGSLSSDSALIGYTPAGTGAVASTVQAKLRESVSVKDFGAVADNATDASTAFSLAEAALPSTGGTIRIDGIYYCASILAFTKKIRFEFSGGVGAASLSSLPSSYIRFSSSITVGPLVTISNHGSTWQGGGIEGGGKGANTNVDNLLILGNSHSLRNMRSWKAGRDGVKVGNGLLSLVICNSGTMDDVVGFECGRYGVNLDNNTSPGIPGNNANAWTLNSVSGLNNTSDGVMLNHADLNIVNGGLCESNTGWGLTIANGNFNVINGGDREANTAGQLRILGSRNGGDGTNISNYTQVNIGNYTELVDADASRIDCTTVNNSKNFVSKGTWTPVVSGSGGTPHAGYTIQQGYWWRDGRNLKLTGAIQISGALSGPTGTVEITGLPLNFDSSFSNGYFGISISQFNGITLAVGLTQLGGRIDANTSKIKLTGSGSATATALLPVSGFGANGQILFSIEMPVGNI